MSSEITTFGAGCFWGVEEAFRSVPGVLSTVVGYMGGFTTNPTYREVCGGDTGHAEVVQISFDHTRLSFEDLLNIFWKIHDPTQYNRQGVDVGEQYRSVIFYYSQEQKKIAESTKEKTQIHFSKPIVTEIQPAKEFYKAEEYHQQYFLKKGGGTCHI